MRRALAAALAAVAALAAPAAASDLVGHATHLAQYQRWVNGAAVPTPSGRIEIVEAPCPLIASARACTSPRAPRIWMGPQAGRHELLHELGHQFDYRMAPWVRRRFLAMIGRPGAGWMAAPASPSEQFANAYADCAMRLRRDAACRLIARAGASRSVSR